MLLQQIRRHSAVSEIQSAVDKERLERIQSFCNRMEDADFCEADMKLMKVQEELLKIYQKVEV